MELDEFGMLGASVVCILFRLGGQFGVGAFVFGLGESELLSECLDLELMMTVGQLEDEEWSRGITLVDVSVERSSQT